MKFKTAQTTVETTSARARFRAVAPEWAALSDKLAELIVKEAAILKELLPLNPQYSREFAASGLARTRKHQPAAAVVDHSPQVKKLLGPLTPPPATKERAAVLESSQKMRWRELAEELDDVRTAIKLIHEPLKTAWLNGSAAYCRHIAPDYQAIASSLCASLIALGHAMRAHDGFAKDLREQGVAWGMLKPMSLTALGSPTDASSEFSRTLKWAIDCGHLHIDDVPADWAARRN